MKLRYLVFFIFGYCLAFFPGIELLADEPKDFQWVAPTQYEDSSPLPISEIDSFNIYCDNGGGFTLLTSVPGTETQANVVMATGSYTCYITTVATNQAESDPSINRSFDVEGVLLKPMATNQFQVN